MRILDNNIDFYDYYQNIYIDNNFTFDRRDSYNLTKEEFCSNFRFYRSRSKYATVIDSTYLLLQVCNTFWLFKLHATKIDASDTCEDYELSLLANWKEYSLKREQLKLSEISFNHAYSWHLFDDDKKEEKDTVNKMIESIRIKDYQEEKVFNNFRFHKGDSTEFRHIPILKNIGLAAFIDPRDIYLSLEEYFSSEKTASERIEAVGTTNSDKITNHGFDLKTSFRGK